MKIVIEIENENFIKGDLLYYDGKKFIGYNKDAVVKELEKQVETLTNELREFKVNVNDRLKEYHRILQLIYKEE